MADETAADAILNEMDAPKKRLLNALVEANGIVTAACNACQMPRSTFYLWMHNDPDFKAAVEDVQEIAIDKVEGILYNLIEARDTTATIFFLKTRAKKRGYVERQEIENSGGMTINWNETRNHTPPNDLADTNK